jgi:hypothetical protein
MISSPHQIFSQLQATGYTIAILLWRRSICVFEMSWETPPSRLGNIARRTVQWTTPTRTHVFGLQECSAIFIYEKLHNLEEYRGDGRKEAVSVAHGKASMCDWLSKIGDWVREIRLCCTSRSLNLSRQSRYWTKGSGSCNYRKWIALKREGSISTRLVVNFNFPNK